MSLRSRLSGSLSPVLLCMLGACANGCGGGSGSSTGDDDTGIVGEDSGADTGGGGDSSSGDTSGGKDTAGDDTTPATDSGGGDTGGGDTGGDDTGAGDTGGGDTGGGDATDGGSGDTTGGDTSDAGTGDAADTADSAPVDTGPPDPCTTTLSCSLDSDGDTIPDVVEGRCTLVDTDTDGTPDYLDTDSDGDTVLDKLEWAGGGCDTSGINDADGDGVPNFRDLDSDGNGLVDKSEICPPAAVLTKVGKPACSVAAGYDYDGDGVMDFLDSDNDHDSASSALEVGLDDKYELVNNAGTYVGLVDTDSDTVPDVYDVDSDNDFMFDLAEGITDTDTDGIPNFRDTDSDADKVPDACEARGKAVPVVADLAVAVKDTDGDSKPDYLDIDSDADLLIDTKEDKNFNCVVDACETSRVVKDTDADGTDDFIEVTLDTGGACWGSDKTKNPTNQGKFYFLEPYAVDGSLPPTPTSSLLALSTTLNNGDVGFVMDTTYSMSGEIANLKASLSGTIIPALAAKIPNLGVGVAGHEDVPNGTYSSCTPYAFPPPVLPADKLWFQSGYITDVSAGGTTIPAGITAAQNQTNALALGNGNDTPEGQVLALIHAVNGDLISWPAGGSCPASNVPADTGTAGVTFGALHFRTAALPILVEISDAQFHNGIRTGSATVHDAYSFGGFTNADLVTKMNALGAKFVGVSADNGGRAGGGPGGDPYNDMAYIADGTSSNVPTTAFTATPTCTAGKCCTGVNGAGIAADGPAGVCRSVYSVNTDGTGLSTSIVNGVYAILASIKFDVYVQAYNDAAATIDVVGDFMQKVEPLPGGGTDPVTGGVCVTFPVAQLADKFVGPKALVAGADTVNDTIKAVNPGNLYCFNVVPKANTIITPGPSAQLFTAWLKVLAVKPSGGTFALGSDRQVLFVVPPLVN